MEKVHKTKCKNLYSLLRIKIARLRESVYDIGKLKERHPEAKTDESLRSKLKALDKQASFLRRAHTITNVGGESIMKRSFNQMANAYVKELRKNKIDQAVIHMFGK